MITPLGPEEQFRLNTADALGRIEVKLEDTYKHVESLNVTVSSQGERISALEGGRRALKTWMMATIAFVALVVSLVVAYVKGGD